MHPNCRSTTQLVLDENYKKEDKPEEIKPSENKKEENYFAKDINVPNKNLKKEILPYIPNFNRKPNKNFYYDDNKIYELTKNIKSINIKSEDVPIFKNTESLKAWVNTIFLKNRNITIKDDNEQILLSKNAAKRATSKQNPNDTILNAVFLNIKEVLEESKFYDFEPIDLRHQNLKKNIQGQYVYFSKIIVDNKPYIVRFKIDVPKDNDGSLLYAGHRIYKK